MAERVGFEPTLGFPKHAFQACAFSRSATSPLTSYRVQSTKLKVNPTLHSELCTLYSVLRTFFQMMAERGGFEPPVELPPQQFSRLPPSAARPPLLSLHKLSVFSPRVRSVARDEESGFSPVPAGATQSVLSAGLVLFLRPSKKPVRSPRLSFSSTPGVMRYT
jgi:hypothetical protein